MFKTIVLTFGVTATLGVVQAQGFKDFLREIGKVAKQEVDRKVEQEVDKAAAPCLAAEDSAKISSADESKSGSHVVVTANGNSYQLRSIAIGGRTDDGRNLAEALSNVSQAEFSLVEASRIAPTYRIRVSYNVQAGSGVVGAILSSAVNKSLERTTPREFKAIVSAVEGVSVAGESWCLSPTSSSLVSIRLVN